MTTIQIRDFFNPSETVGVRVNPQPIIGKESQSAAGGYTHYAYLTGSQISSLYRRLSNGPRGINVIQQDRYTGKATAAEIYFDLA